ncbi:hypothetical protein BCV69DRAFT_244371 [Microstroma glucosiphilum]|uniref:EKC/KEOPS complex subunit CGI121 n=1 Tax=Pseudomicrostroma glucosiphilum TaxID=1684307 RepID=A0A316UFJ5_9BASI|nr:hypothetical protein BCV69DRAFT_244371 [Pseudomicrostroma glucosiphilum]PWN24026.1 hypothetical protein BCV69DRAFT_244371 [Pseudomicrostroma glucosiphilum]
METYTFPHFHPESNTVHLALFHSVSNAQPLLSQIINAASLPTGHPDQIKVDFAFIDAGMVVSREQVLNAVLQSMVWKERGEEGAIGAGSGGLKTKTIHSEVIWNLFPGRNISSSLREVGLSPKTTSLLLVHICSSSNPQPSEILSRMTNLVQGTLDVSGLSSLEHRADAGEGSAGTNWKELTKLYKIDESVDNEERRRAVVESATAIKNVAG